jgi:tRNA1Val (adenine37-N6)-methyltransferase
MSNNYFNFKQFTIDQDKSAFKVSTDGVLLGACADITGAGKILDVGTGTGLIALMLAQRCEAQITAIEPDRDSFEQACSNVRKSKWHNRIKVVNSTLQNFDPGGATFDLIITNPPWFTDSLRNPDPGKAAARHNITLDNAELLKGVIRFLADTGRFQVIMPYVEGNILIAEAVKYGLYCISILKIKPLPASEIRRMILTFSKHRLRPAERFLTIEHGKNHEFTGEYMNLTKEFYLKF